MSQLKVNSIVPVGGLPSGSNGGIIQVVQDTKTDTQSITGQTFVDVAGLSVSITPSSNSNKILIYYSISFGTSDYAVFDLLRGSTSIFQGGSDGSRVPCTFGGAQINQYATITMAGCFLDSPSTTSATTYKFQAKTPHQNSHNVYINRVKTDNDANYVIRPVSSITAMEVTV